MRRCWQCGRGLEDSERINCSSCPQQTPFKLVQFIKDNPTMDAHTLYSKIAGSQMGVEWYSIQYQFQAAEKEISKLANSGFYSSGYLQEKLEKVERYSREWFENYAHILRAVEVEA